MLKKMKRIGVSLMGVALMVGLLGTSTSYAKEYDDQYAKNGSIEMKTSEDYGVRYVVNNNANCPNHVVMFVVYQDDTNVKSTRFSYDFDGKFNDEEQYSTVGFTYEFGFPNEKEVVNDKVELGNETGILCKEQFGVYPGFYNFYFYGANEMLRGNGTACFMKTCTPSFELSVKDMYDPSLWVEIPEGMNQRIYVLVGEKSWIEKVTPFFEIWAKEYEHKSIENSAMGTEEIEVTVDTEKLQEIVENKEDPVVEEVKDDGIHFPTVDEYTRPENEQKESTFSVGSSVFISVGVVVFVAVVIGIALFIQKKKRDSE